MNFSDKKIFMLQNMFKEEEEGRGEVYTT